MQWRCKQREVVGRGARADGDDVCVNVMGCGEKGGWGWFCCRRNGDQLRWIRCVPKYKQIRRLAKFVVAAYVLNAGEARLIPQSIFWPLIRLSSFSEKKSGNSATRELIRSLATAVPVCVAFVDLLRYDR